ncbi:MAG: SdrD B-like domain-containing protein, partial [Chloroflexota bacterium]
SKGSIRGIVFEDANRNGIRDQDEEGIPGVKVTITSVGGWQASFTSGDDGTFAPAGLSAAYYSVEVEVPEGYVSTGPVRYEGIGIGISGRLALGIDFPITQATVPSGLPATGFGPGAIIVLPVIGLIFLAGAMLVWQLRRGLQD